MMIPEGEFSLWAPPEPEVLVKLNESLHALQQGFGMARLGEEHENSSAAMAAELMRQQTAFIRNDGFPSQIRRLQKKSSGPSIRRSLNQGFTLSEVVDSLWPSSGIGLLDSV